MKSRLMSEAGGERSFILVLDEGDEVLGTLAAFAHREKIASASLSATGAFTRATLGWFDLAARAYREIPVEEQCEVLSLTGSIAVADDGTPSLHAQTVLGLKDGSTRGGHLLEGMVLPTMEVMLVEVTAPLRRTQHPSRGVALLEL